MVRKVSKVLKQVNQMYPAASEQKKNKKIKNASAFFYHVPSMLVHTYKKFIAITLYSGNKRENERERQEEGRREKIEIKRVYI